MEWEQVSPAVRAQVSRLRSELGDESDRGDVVGTLTWAVDRIEAVPDVPLEVWRAAVDDLATACADGHRAPGPVHAARARLAVALDDDEALDAELAAWEATGCWACATRDRALVAALTDPRAALDLLAPVTAGGRQCSQEPRRSLTHEAELRAELGDVDGAALAFRRAWDLVADDPGMPQSVARCLRVLVRIGNTDRAVALLAPRLAWLTELRTGADRMWFAGTAAWVLHHARRLGVAPATVDGRPVVEVQDECAGIAEGLAARFDARAGTDVTTRHLLGACDDALVVSGPTLPPTRLGVLPADPGPSAPAPATGAEVVALAARVLAARRAVEPGVETALRGWAASRAAVLPRLSTPREWAAASALDRSSCYLLRDLDAERVRLTDAAAAAARGADDGAAAHARADLAVLDVRAALRDSGGLETPAVADARARVTAAVRALESAGRTEAAADVLRWSVVTTRPADGEAGLRRAADLYAALGMAPRQALSLLDAAIHVPGGPPAVERLVAEAEAVAGEHPVVRAQALDVRARLARASGDLDGAAALHEESLDAAGRADGTRIQALFALCDLLVDLGDWARLEPRAADALALATRLHDPVALAVAQRHLGLAWLETGRPAEATELVAAALPVIAEHVPPLAGPTAWALGNAHAAVGAWAQACSAFTTAADGFAAVGRTDEAAHAHYRAGMTAWEADDTATGSAHLDAALAAARAAGSVEVHLAALRSRAALHASTGDLDAGLADLDAALAETERFAAGLPPRPDEDDFDAEELEPDVLRQGAHLLAAAGRTEDAVARLDAAEDLVGGDFALVLRAEAGIVLAGADRLDAAEPRLLDALDALDGAGLEDERVTAAQVLANALDRAGRVEDAEAVWARYGPGVDDDAGVTTPG